MRPHGDGASLALAAPFDQLFTATEVNEWALCSALRRAIRALGRRCARRSRRRRSRSRRQPTRGPAGARRGDGARAARASSRPPSAARAAWTGARPSARGLPWLLDDDELTLGAGERRPDAGRSTALPAVADVPWAELHDIPTALVTGSNGKTTTVRLVAACCVRPACAPATAAPTACSWTTSGSRAATTPGPAGARPVLRDPRVEAAVLETARGGILRRGLAVARADAAVVTNVSADHFGEYGIHDLDALADVKLTVGAAVAPRGLLVLNADDATLRAKARASRSASAAALPLGWFARDADHPFLAAHRAAGGATCGVRDGRLLLCSRGVEHDLGAVAAMPLTVGGRADYNVANLAAAALAAAALGVAPDVIAGVFARFGSGPGDNPGRLHALRASAACT